MARISNFARRFFANFRAELRLSALRFGRRVIGLCLGAMLGWMCADFLLHGDDGMPPVGAPAKQAPAYAVFKQFPDWVHAVAFAPDNKTLAAGSYGVVKVFDVAQKKELASLEMKGSLKAVAFSPDGQLLAVGGYQAISCWNTADWKLTRTLTGPKAQVTGLAFSPDGKLLASSCEDEAVTLWNAATGEAVHTMTGHELPVTSVAFFPDGTRVASTGSDLTRPTKGGSLKVWDVASGKETLSVPAHDKAVTAVAVSPDNKRLATSGLDEVIKLWDVQSGKELQELEGHTRAINHVVFLADGKHLASCSGGRNQGGNEARLWDLSTGKTGKVLPGHEGPVQQVAVSSDGRILATASLDKTVRIVSLSNDKPVTAVAQAVAAEVKAEKPEAQATEKPADKPEGKAVDAPKTFRAGIIGLDTSHAPAFTGALNAKMPKPELAGCPVVAAYPKGSPDIASSTVRVPEYTAKLKELGVEIVDSIEDLLTKVDVVFLETNDGRPHFDQVLPVLKARKPVFIDKPVAGSLADAVAIYEAAKKYNTPVFSSSSLRFAAGAQALRNGKIGKILGCDAYSPCSLEATHPDLFWYGIHGVESLFTVMGPGCESVSRVTTPDFDVAVGKWKDGRIGTFRGIRSKAGSGYGGTAFGEKGIEQIGTFGGYDPLVVEAVKFFRTGVPPVTPEETLDIYAFMEAADESKRQGGAPVTLQSVFDKARAAAAEKLAKIE